MHWCFSCQEVTLLHSNTNKSLYWDLIEIFFLGALVKNAKFIRTQFFLRCNPFLRLQSLQTIWGVWRVWYIVCGFLKIIFLKNTLKSTFLKNLNDAFTCLLLEVLKLSLPKRQMFHWVLWHIFIYVADVQTFRWNLEVNITLRRVI